MADVMECTRAGTCCGGCHPTIEDILEEEREPAAAAEERRSLPVVPSNLVCA